MTFHIKNMVCPRCVMVVTDILNQLQLPPQQVTPGQATVANDAISTTQKAALSNGLLQLGFQLLHDKQTILVAQIKSLIIQQIRSVRKKF